MFTTTGTHAQAEEGDMPINSAAGLITGLRTEVPQGVEFFADPNLTRRLGAMSSNCRRRVRGQPDRRDGDGR